MTLLSPEAETVLHARYLWDGETPELLFHRVANYVAKAEAGYGRDTAGAAQEYFELMSSLAFLPNSPALINAGKPKAQLAACFVLPIEDTLEGIFDTLKHTALIHQSGGGTGFSFSRLRPEGDRVGTTGGVSSGPISFMHIYDMATQVVKQGAARRGANMAILRVDHPDILSFITVKRRRDALNNFNLSVGVTDVFMEAVHNQTDFELVNPHDGMAVKTVPAKEIFDLLVQMAWENGEPGLFFLDTVNRANPTLQLGKFESPNPCSEQPLLPYESCVLGSINLTKMLHGKGQQLSLNKGKLAQTVRTAVRFLDNVIDVNCYPLPEVAKATRQTRKIGLGIMGLAELFILLDLPYASEQAVQLTRDIMEFITAEGRAMSEELGCERGNFPAFTGSIFPRQGYSNMRNATVTTIAPTGTISMIANCSSGIEPLFGLAMTRRVLDGRLITSVNQVAIDYLKNWGLYSQDVYERIAELGSVAGLSLPDRAKNVLATAHEIEPSWHVAHLAAAQQYTDNGVSKTVNLPKNATLQDVAEVFLTAYARGCKGVTVYRDTSRDQQVLTHGVSGSCEECQL
ncbi:adenosylcobalamin-dependent ribonucleoside-diphosphate reductase [Sporomusa sp.]|uniref:adenosylcobalamin-dependent ribonucleoside-diphosphate reductase n=1 Tax=Sporomusa sp. TaxID=2078658 RepID=UPI002C6CD7C3|nr:adenosylcobalamin-dependent ribonucleoside-diphosphate reductase [Sporomusa sp.]HWR43818.1 adenosylcobalamin-dependent ribonucleoside-diphosphate reductase [Sporomusa sp.]